MEPTHEEKGLRPLIRTLRRQVRNIRMIRNIRNIRNIRREQIVDAHAHHLDALRAAHPALDGGLLRFRRHEHARGAAHVMAFERRNERLLPRAVSERRRIQAPVRHAHERRAGAQCRMARAQHGGRPHGVDEHDIRHRAASSRTACGHRDLVAHRALLVRETRRHRRDAVGRIAQPWYDVEDFHSVTPTFGQAWRMRPRFSARVMPASAMLRDAPNVSAVTRPCRV